MKATGHHRAIACGLFVLLVAVYWYSVPTAFNTVYMNRQFFDSDGEFITRQFRLGSVFTHNDHLLYHVTARVGARVAGALGYVDPSAVVVHKLMSVVSGALAGACLFLFGYRLTGRVWGPLGAALMMTGAAGWWFFSATIDTYMPNVLASVLALGAALSGLRTRQAADFGLLGAAMGLAFLLRTDSFLLAVLGSALLVEPKRLGRNLAACVCGGLVVGIIGYIVLAKTFYGVPLSEMVSWSLGHSGRPETSRMWGLTSNITFSNLALVTANHAVYSVWLPGLMHTRMPDVFAVGLGSLAVYAALAATVASGVALSLRSSLLRRESVIVVVMASAWLVSRVAFYAWWDPADPFLFAGLSLPAIWLLAVQAMRNSRASTELGRPASLHVVVVEVVVWLTAVVVWWHNWSVMVDPLRHLPT